VRLSSAGEEECRKLLFRHRGGGRLLQERLKKNYKKIEICSKLLFRHRGGSRLLQEAGGKKIKKSKKKRDIQQASLESQRWEQS
jgi:hypothetical protein